MSDVYLVLFMAEAVCEGPLYLRKMAFYSLPETGHNLDFFFGSAQHEVYGKDSSSLNAIGLHMRTVYKFIHMVNVLFLPPLLFPLPSSQDPIKQPMILTRDKQRKKDAVKLFKLVLQYMGDRKSQVCVVTSSATMFLLFSLLLCGCNTYLF